MKRADLRGPIVFGLILLLAQLPVMGASTPLGNVIPRTGTTLVNGTALALETTIFSGDTVATQEGGTAQIMLPRGNQVHLGPASSAVLSGDAHQVVVTLTQGMTVARSGNGQQVSVMARGLLVQPSGAASYEVALDGSAILVSALQGSVEVQGTNRSFVVPAGKAMKFELAANSAPGPTGVGAQNMAPGAAAAIAIAVSVGVSVPVAMVYANNKADDARRDACIAAIRAVSPSGSTASCQ